MAERVVLDKARAWYQGLPQDPVEERYPSARKTEGSIIKRIAYRIWQERGGGQSTQAMQEGDWENAMVERYRYLHPEQD